MSGSRKVKNIAALVIFGVLSLLLLAISVSMKNTSGRVASPDQFVRQIVDILRRGDKEAWWKLQMSRSEYKKRCPLLLKRNSPGWLDRTMAQRKKPHDGAFQRCKGLQSNRPLKILRYQGGGPTTEFFMNECTGYEPRDSFYIIVENEAGKRYQARIDVIRDLESSNVYIPSGYVECHSADR